MVSLTSHSLIEKRERTLRSVDLSIRDLLAEGERDPVALALYLWVVRSHDASLVNKDGLASWGVAWVRRVFIEKQIGRRRDEHIVSAALAAAALVGTRALSPIEEGVREAVRESLSTELDQRPIPFGQLSYASMLLFAAAVLGINEPRAVMTAVELGNALRDAASGGRVFGISFAVQVLRRTQESECLNNLLKDVSNALEDPRISYEDEVYLLQALSLTTNASSALDTKRDTKVVEFTDHLLDRSPVWSYLFVGTEDVEAAGDGSVAVSLSHLCRAALLDLILRVGIDADARADAMLDSRYRGRRFVGLSAFGFALLVLAGIWGLLGSMMMPWTDAAWQYWVQNNYGAMSQPSALLFLAGVMVLLFLLFFTPVAAWTLWGLLVRSSVESDRRIAEVLAKRTWWILKAWLVLLALQFLIGIVAGLLGPAFQHSVGGK